MLWLFVIIPVALVVFGVLYDIRQGTGFKELGKKKHNQNAEFAKTEAINHAVRNNYNGFGN